MHRDFIAQLRCPYTGSAVTVSSAGAETATAILYGSVTTEAGEFPIVAGVLRLLTDDLRGPILELVKTNRHEAALQAALEVPFLKDWETMADAAWRRAARQMKSGAAYANGPHKKQWYQLVSQTDVPFRRLAASASGERWRNWQSYRFSMPTFFPVYALAHLAQTRRSILDFGCGIGHSSFVLQQLAPNASIVCADYSFSSMYLAKRFLSPRSECICLDGDYPLPFTNGYFDCVFSTDALQYIQPKVGLTREFKRILTPDGIVTLAHLHNGLSGIKAGHALTPAGYEGLFDGMQRRLYPEEQIVADYVSEGTLRLDRHSDDATNSAALKGVSLVAANSDAPFQSYTGLLDSYVRAMRRPAVNPAYEQRREGGQWILDRKIDAPYAVERAIGDYTILPKTFATKVDSLETADLLNLRQTAPATLVDLVRRSVVLDLPLEY